MRGYHMPIKIRLQRFKAGGVVCALLSCFSGTCMSGITAVYMLIYYKKNHCVSMRKPVMSSMIAKTFFSFAASNFAASEAPTGANRIVNGTMQRKAAKLTNPKVLAGASAGVLPKTNIVRAPGSEMIKPTAAAVPTAL